jgi:hypothetical protein
LPWAIFCLSAGLSGASQRNAVGQYKRDIEDTRGLGQTDGVVDVE